MRIFLSTDAGGVEVNMQKANILINPEDRILNLLAFKTSVFMGVLDEEGKDQVKIDGFLDTVNAQLQAAGPEGKSLSSLPPGMEKIQTAAG